MGEQPQQSIEITFGSETIQALAEAFAAGRRAGEQPTTPAQTPYDLGLEPWTFHSPSHKADVMAYVDDRNQVRHVPLTRTSEVPKTWRRVWLEPPA